MLLRMGNLSTGWELLRMNVYHSVRRKGNASDLAYDVLNYTQKCSVTDKQTCELLSMPLFRALQVVSLLTLTAILCSLMWYGCGLLLLLGLTRHMHMASLWMQSTENTGSALTWPGYSEHKSPYCNLVVGFGAEAYSRCSNLQYTPILKCSVRRIARSREVHVKYAPIVPVQIPIPQVNIIL